MEPSDPWPGNCREVVGCLHTTVRLGGSFWWTGRSISRRSDARKTGRRVTPPAHTMEIQGSAAFITRTRNVLAMLDGTQAFADVEPYIAIIREAERSGMRAYDPKPTYEVGAPTWQHSELWYAGCIVHDGYHSKLYHEAKVMRGGAEPPPESWTGAEAERGCLALQLRALVELGADSPLVDYVKRMLENPTYHGDPKSWADYNMRKW